MTQDQSRDCVAFDEGVVRRALAQKIGSLTADNEVLLAVLENIRSENDSLRERLCDIDVQRSVDAQEEARNAEEAAMIAAGIPVGVPVVPGEPFEDSFADASRIRDLEVQREQQT